MKRLFCPILLFSLLFLLPLSAGGHKETFPSTRTTSLSSYEPDHNRWGYRNLSSREDRVLYETFKAAIETGKPTVTIAPADNEYLFGIFLAVLNDYPEYFWVDSRLAFSLRSINGIPKDMEVSFTYTTSGEDLVDQKEKVDDVSAKILKKVEKIDDPYEQVKWVYTYLITETKYRAHVTDQSMYSVLVKNKGVCAGYARAFQYIMRNLGFESIIVTGDLKQNGKEGGVLSLFTPFVSDKLNGHAWNMVRIGNAWYHVDPTSGEALTPMNKDISYDYLCIPTQQILNTHTINPEETIPPAASYELEYYRTHGLFLDRYDIGTYRKLFKKAEEGKERDLDVRFSTIQVLQQAADDLIGNQKIFDIIDDDKVTYFIDDVNLILSVDIP